jgi:hypothetical protein
VACEYSPSITPDRPLRRATDKRVRRRKRKLTRLVRIPQPYFEVVEVAKLLFPALYQFENGLRLAIHHYLETCYGTDWWATSLQSKLPKVFEYEAAQRARLAAMSWLGASTRVAVLPVHLVTLGHLEEIIKRYQSDCIPELFPTLDFFTGHMEVIKRVRNMYSHMFPCISRNDAVVARREILTLAAHINVKLDQFLP